MASMRRLRLLEPVADAVDAGRDCLELSLEPRDATVEDLELLEALEMRIHHLVGPPGLEPGPNRL